MKFRGGNPGDGVGPQVSPDGQRTACEVSFPITSTALLIKKVPCEISGETGTRLQMR